MFCYLFMFLQKCHQLPSTQKKTRIKRKRQYHHFRAQNRFNKFRQTPRLVIREFIEPAPTSSSKLPVQSGLVVSRCKWWIMLDSVSSQTKPYLKRQLDQPTTAHFCLFCPFFCPLLALAARPLHLTLLYGGRWEDHLPKKHRFDKKEKNDIQFS